MFSRPLFRQPLVQGVIITIGFLMLVIIIVGSCADVDSSLTEPMTATVRIKAGAIYVINEDTFPWYGLIITLHDRWTTEHRFDDQNWPWLRDDSILLPSEETKPAITAFIDDRGSEYEGKLYTIIAVKVTLRAKTSVDGPYDLETSFDFTKDDPIVDSSIGRTNKSIEPNGALHATPYVLTESIERRPTLHIYMNNPYRFEYVEHHELYYDEVKAYVSSFPQNGFGSYQLTGEAYEEMMIRFNMTSVYTLSPGIDDSVAQWQEQWTHWENIDAFFESIGLLSTDRIVDEEESRHVCFAFDQWTAQMNAAWNYVQAYRNADPETVEKNPGLESLEREAKRALGLLEQVECE